MNKEKYLGISLNCGLKVILNRKGKFNLDEEYPEPHNEICEVVEVLKSNSSFDYEISDGNVSYGFIELDEFDFICRPLTDITKPIEHKGEKFVPLERIKELFIEGTEDVLSQSIEAIEYFIENNFFSRIEYLPFILIQKLIDWHFDIAGLIEKGEAIDVNTLIENPYK